MIGDFEASAIVCSVAALSLVGLAPNQAVAGDGFAAGLFGGLAVGTILGAAASRPRVYYAEPVYAPTCYWTLGRPSGRLSRNTVDHAFKFVIERARSSKIPSRPQTDARAASLRCALHRGQIVYKKIP